MSALGRKRTCEEGQDQQPRVEVPAPESAIEVGALAILRRNAIERRSKRRGARQGKFRHPDHRFEWSRQDFEHWAESLARAHGYEVRFEGIGIADPGLGAPTQMGVFTRAD